MFRTNWIMHFLRSGWVCAIFFRCTRIKLLCIDINGIASYRTAHKEFIDMLYKLDTPPSPSALLSLSLKDTADWLQSVFWDSVHHCSKKQIQKLLSAPLKWGIMALKTSCDLMVFPDLTINPPEGSFGHAMQLDEDLLDVSRIQWQNELLFKLTDIHTGRRWWEQNTNSVSTNTNSVSTNSKKSSSDDEIFIWSWSWFNDCILQDVPGIS